MRTWQAIGLVAIVLVFLAVAVTFLTPLVTPAPTPSPTVARPSPTATAAPPKSSPPTAAPATRSPSPSPPATVEALADRLGDALEASDFDALRALIDPAGFFYQLYQTDGTPPITPDQAIDRLKRTTNAPDGRLHVQVQRRPIRARTGFQPPADDYIASTWDLYDNMATERVDLMLKNEAGRWYWSGGLFNAPQPPPGP